MTQTITVEEPPCAYNGHWQFSQGDLDNIRAHVLIPIDEMLERESQESTMWSSVIGFNSYTVNLHRITIPECRYPLVTQLKIVGKTQPHCYLCYHQGQQEVILYSPKRWEEVRTRLGAIETCLGTVMDGRIRELRDMYHAGFTVTGLGRCVASPKRGGQTWWMYASDIGIPSSVGISPEYGAHATHVLISVQGQAWGGHYCATLWDSFVNTLRRLPVDIQSGLFNAMPHEMADRCIQGESPTLDPLPIQS